MGAKPKVRFLIAGLGAVVAHSGSKSHFRNIGETTLLQLGYVTVSSYAATAALLRACQYPWHLTFSGHQTNPSADRTGTLQRGKVE
jgi:hypothetical protein